MIANQYETPAAFGRQDVFRFRHPSRYASSICARAGNGVPSTYSRNAPPPVETCVIFSARPNSSTASAVSPPPTIVTALDAASASATARVPLLYGSSSYLPSGPFQTTV